jgi:hypothetical protein
LRPPGRIEDKKGIEDGNQNKESREEDEEEEEQLATYCNIATATCCTAICCLRCLCELSSPITADLKIVEKIILEFFYV